MPQMLLAGLEKIEDIVTLHLTTTQHGLGSEAKRAGVTLFDRKSVKFEEDEFS